MYSPQELFIARVDELKQILANPTEKNLSRSSLRLRQLLLDGLIHRANQTVREKFYFIVTGLTARPNPNHPAAQGAVFSQVNLAPSPAFPMIPQRRLDLDDFLKLEVLHYQGHTMTVREVVKYIANYSGEVHFAKPDTPETESLEAAAKAVKVMGMPSVLQSLAGVIQVVVTALEPLYDKLRA